MINSLPPQIAALERLATALDSQFTLPIVGWRLGWDGIIGLIPGIGDFAGAGLGAYLLLTALRLGARKRILMKMLFNLLFDALIGLIPLIGDFADFVNKAHAKNARMIIAEYHAGQLSRLHPPGSGYGAA
ncbi:MAG: DUF4112 domain-containing protein [Pseudomonadota bacterium]